MTLNDPSLVSPSKASTAEVPLPDADAAARLERSRRVARWLDVRWTLPGTRIGVGLDALIGLLPVVGDSASAASSLWIVDQARRAGVRRRALARMLVNVLVDLGVGSVPLIGDLFDVAWRANSRNVAVFERELARGSRSEGRS